VPPRGRSREKGAYFAPALPRVLAHRGLAVEVPENTLSAFRAALDVGAQHLETDVHASADGIAVISHDPDLHRIAGRRERVEDLTMAQLRAIDLGGGETFVSLAEVLEAFPEARFNIDVKSEAACRPTAEAVRDAGATDRVLITSFDARRKRLTVSALPGVATSASAAEFVPALLFAKMGWVAAVRRMLRDVDAVQIPSSVYGVRTVTPRTVDAMHGAGVEIHVWTINDVEEARSLLERGADGIVTDRADIMVPLAAEFKGVR
jgi:glycerophosphoryl diester phosphodiesterase